VGVQGPHKEAAQQAVQRLHHIRLEGGTIQEQLLQAQKRPTEKIGNHSRGEEGPRDHTGEGKVVELCKNGAGHRRVGTRGGGTAAVQRRGGGEELAVNFVVDGPNR